MGNLMKSVLRWIGAAATVGVIWFIAQYQSPVAAITVLAAVVIFSALNIEARLRWHGKLLNKLNGVSDPDED